jgi:hypothetical protein
MKKKNNEINTRNMDMEKKKNNNNNKKHLKINCEIKE